MSGFDVNAITDAGSLLIAKVMASKGSITFTRIVMGDGYMPSSQVPEHMTAVVSPKATMEITKCEVTGNGAAVVGGRYDNSEQSQDFEWRELGLYAKDPDLGEILYSYGNTGESAETIPAGGGATAIEKLIDVVTYVGNDVNVTAEFAPYVVPSADEITITNKDNRLSVKDGGITSAKLAADSVTADKVADGSIGTAELMQKSVQPQHISDPAAHRNAMGLGNTLAALDVAHGGTGQTTIDGVRRAVFNFPSNDELLTYLGLK